MTAQQPDLKFELLQAEDHSRYVLREKREVAFVLKQIAARRCVISAYYGNTGSFLTSSVVAVDEAAGTLLLDLGRDEEVNAEALKSGSLVCITQLDKVKIQFPFEQLKRTLYEGFPALVAPLPKSLLRLQRREYYRLTTPVADTVICAIPLDEDGPRTVEAKVLDISGGGVAVLVPPSTDGFQPDTQYHKCRLELPEFGIVEASLRIRNVFRFTNPKGVEMLRAGCQFSDLPTSMANAIQRYILKVERERKSLGIYT